MLKAVIFDMDDTLLDWSQRSEDWQTYEHSHLEQVFNYVAREVHPLRAPDAFYEAAHHLAHEAWVEAEQGLVAPSLGVIMAKALEQVGVPAELIDVDAVLHAYDWQPLGGVIAFPDVGEVLPMFVAQGIKIGLVTNAFQPMWMRDRELAAFGLLAHFADCRLSAADVGYLKPHPSIFRAALDCLGVTADEAVFIGDNLAADIAGAQSIGMRGVWRVIARNYILGGEGAVDPIVPDAKINTLHDLPPILDAWYPGWRSPADQPDPQQTPQAAPQQKPVD